MYFVRVLSVHLALDLFPSSTSLRRLPCRARTRAIRCSLGEKYVHLLGERVECAHACLIVLLWYTAHLVIYRRPSDSALMHAIFMMVSFLSNTATNTKTLAALQRTCTGTANYPVSYTPPTICVMYPSVLMRC